MPFNQINKDISQASSLPERQHLNSDMFGNRKRKPDEDESLVPHGLIWYATPEAPAEENEESLDTTVHYAQAIEMMRRPRAEQDTPEPAAPSTDDTKEQAPETPWWRVPSPQEDPAAIVNVRPTLAEPVPAAPPVPATPPAQVVEIPATVLETKPLSEAKNEASWGYAKWVADCIESGIDHLRSSNANAWRAMKESGARLRERTSALSRSVDWNEKLTRGRNFSGQLVRGAANSAQAYTRRSQAMLRSGGRAGFQNSQQLAAKLSDLAKKRAKDLSRGAKVPELNLPEIKMPSFNAPRVRIVLTGLPLRMRIFFMRQLTAWRLKEDGKPADVRLRTSMAMAAITAAIALTVLSVVPRYAARFLPSRLTAVQSTVSASSTMPLATPVQTVTPVPAATKVAAAKVVAEGSSVPSVKAKTAPTVTTAKVAPAPKPRHHVADDYVAPDTYKYYGNNSASK